MTDEGRHAALMERLLEVAREAAAASGVELVELALRGSSRKRVLRLDIDRPGPAGVNLDDCTELSRIVGQALEEDDALPESYLLEVSSPGIDRPIRTPDDIRRNTGRRVHVKMARPVGGADAFRGVLQGLSAGLLILSTEDGGEVRLSWDEVEKIVQDVGF